MRLRLPAFVGAWLHRKEEKRRLLRKKMITGICGLLAFFTASTLLPLLYVAVGCPDIDVPATASQTSAPQDPRILSRAEESTYLTLPEWYIVYSAEEFADTAGHGYPEHFPYLGAIGQYWCTYGNAYALTRDRYPFNVGYHAAMLTIGTGFTWENLLKGTYENTVGRVSGLISGHDSDEDAFIAGVARDYAAFIHATPFYQFPYGEKIVDIWMETDLIGQDAIRGLERKIGFTTEYAGKAVYAAVIRVLTGAAYAPDDARIGLIVESDPSVLADPRIETVGTRDDGTTVITVPRYEPFTEIALELARRNVRILSAAGNDEIVLTAIAPAGWTGPVDGGRLLFSQPVLIDETKQRIAVHVPLYTLPEAVKALELADIRIVHLYDY